MVRPEQPVSRYPIATQWAIRGFCSKKRGLNWPSVPAARRSLHLAGTAILPHCPTKREIFRMGLKRNGRIDNVRKRKKAFLIPTGLASVAVAALAAAMPGAVACLLIEHSDCPT